MTPKLILIAGASALALSAALYALAGGSERNSLTLPVLTTRPVTPSCVRGTAPTSNNITIISQKAGITCYTFTDPKVYQGAYINLSGIRKAVNALGGSVETSDSGVTHLKLSNRIETYSVKLPSSFTVNGEKYFYAAAIASSFYQNQPSQVRLQGYNRPVVISNNLKLQFGNGTQPEVGPAFYQGMAVKLLEYLLYGDAPDGRVTYNISSSSIPFDSSGKTHELMTPLKVGEVAMLVTRRAGENYDLDVAPVNANGQVTLRSSFERLLFVSSLAQLGPDRTDGRTPALLVQVTNIPLNNLKSGIFVPKQTTSDATSIPQL